MRTETIKSKRHLSHSMEDLYILEHIEEILKRRNTSRGYIIATSYRKNLYSHTFAQCEKPQEIGRLDKIVVETFGRSDTEVAIPFDTDDIREEKSQDLKNYLNQHFRNKHQILKTNCGLELFQRNADGSLIRPKSSLVYPKENLSKEIKLTILMSIPVVNIHINEYIVINLDWNDN